MVLVKLVGGLPEFLAIFRSFAAKTQALPAANPDGPWHQYLLEMLRLDPVVWSLAAIGLLILPVRQSACRYLLGFFAVSCFVVCNFSTGMTLPFTTVWVLPASVFAAALLIALTSRVGNRAALASIALFGIVCASGLWQYRASFMDGGNYETTPKSLLKAARTGKEPVSPRP
jgi:hypothetical protein